MNRTKPKPERQFPSRVATSPVSVRFEKVEMDWIETEAAKMGYSANRFIITGMKGVREMIETPDGQPMREPELVSLARFVRKPIIGSVTSRKG